MQSTQELDGHMWVNAGQLESTPRFIDLVKFAVVNFQITLRFRTGGKHINL